MRIATETEETEVRGRRIRESQNLGLGGERQNTVVETRERPPRTTTSPSAQAGEDLNALSENLRTRKTECEKGTRPFSNDPEERSGRPQHFGAHGRILSTHNNTFTYSNVPEPWRCIPDMVGAGMEETSAGVDKGTRTRAMVEATGFPRRRPHRSTSATVGPMS